MQGSHCHSLKANSTDNMHIAICISTYKRPILLQKLLCSLANQRTDAGFSYSIVVADNDAMESAREIIAEIAANYPVPLSYCTEPRRNIAHVRNMSLKQSRGELIAFIDDDEFAEDDWLNQLHHTLITHDCAGVLGPVRPLYPPGTPEWIQRGGFFERPEHKTGFVMPWQGCRTGNVLFRRSIIAGLEFPFNPEFGTGGSDVDFFRRMIACGHRFIWSNEAYVHEEVSPTRWTRRILMKRALLRGQNSFRHPRGRLKGILKALLALPFYTLLLPFLQLGGHHLFMKYLVKSCDHAGRLLALLHIPLIRTRDM